MTCLSGGPERRYWLDERRGYVPLSEFPPLLLALRKAGSPSWARNHPAEPTIRERAQQIIGKPAYLVDDETWEAAEAQATAERESGEPVRLRRQPR